MTGQNADLAGRLIYVIAACLLLLSLLSFAIDPAYKDGAYEGVIAFSNVLSFLVGLKLSRPQDPPQISDTPSPSDHKSDTSV